MWSVPEWSRSQVNKAGEVLRQESADPIDRIWANVVVNNWRAAHSYPLNTFQMLLRQRARVVDDRSTVAQRLKRLPSIESKLHRFATMNATQIQDIGGCRAVVASIGRVRRLKRIFETHPTAHELVGCDDYLSGPQSDGYRGVHFVFRHYSKVRTEYDRLLIEVQLRSKLQHVWATAVETVDTFQGESLKIGKGNPQWERFFALMGTVIAISEDSPPVPGTPTARAALRSELRDLARALEVRRKLRSYRLALKTMRDPRLRGADTFLLILKPDEAGGEHRLEIVGYEASDRELATKQYAEAEQRLRESQGSHVVLVRVESLRKLGRAYPNYFLDARDFLKLLTEGMR